MNYDDAAPRSHDPRCGGAFERWTEILPGVLRWKDSCNVYAVIGPEGAVVVDAGTGRWLDHLDELPTRVVAVACTHFFRDHTAGAVEAARRGIPIYVPEGELTLFADPNSHFSRIENSLRYENYWAHYLPIEAIPVAGVLRDYETIELGGLEFEVLPLPGVTVTQAGLAVGLPQTGQAVVFSGEAIHSHGRMARLAPLQWHYRDMSGAVAAFGSARELRARRAACLLPSLGEPILVQVDAALGALEQTLRRLCAGRTERGPESESALLSLFDAEGLHRVSDHVWQSTQADASSTFLISASGRVLAIDYGYHLARGVSPDPLVRPWTRRALLHSLDELAGVAGTNKIDVVLVTHYHDDHVCGIPLLRRRYGTECWASVAFADILEDPLAFGLPCTWSSPVTVDRRIGVHEAVEWEGYEFCFAPMSGHTRFSALIGFESDGIRYAHTGDQYFFQSFFSTGDHTEWDKDRIFQNHVYRNGALLDGYRQSSSWLLDWSPDVVLSGHQPPMYTDAKFFAVIREWTQEYEELHRGAMPLGDEDAHFGLDSRAGSIEPYRTHLSHARPARVTVTVRNPLPHRAQLEVRLVGPSGWRGSEASTEADAHAETSVMLEIVPTEPCRRQAFAVELEADGRPFGQVGEALLSVGGPAF